LWKKTALRPFFLRYPNFHNFGGSMTAEIGSLVRWGKSSPTRLGYKACDIGKVIGVHNGRSGGDELDVEFPDGDVIRGAFEEWFERAQLGTEKEAPDTKPL